MQKSLKILEIGDQAEKKTLVISTVAGVFLEWTIAHPLPKAKVPAHHCLPPVFFTRPKYVGGDFSDP